MTARTIAMTLHGRAARRKAAPAAPEPAPLADPTGLAGSLSPVDLPEPAATLPHPLRWTTEAIAVATLTLALLNAHALRGWSYQLPPNDYSARVVTAAEAWYDVADRAGLNRPVEAMHGWWQSAKDVRFGGGVATGSNQAPEGTAHR